MRVFSVPVFASALLASAALLGEPAFAQNAANPSVNGQAGSQAGNQAMPHHNPQQMEQQLKQSLEKSGFKNVQIHPEAYLVRAQAPDGSHMVMMIGPDEVREVIRSGSSTMPSQRGNTGNAMQNNGGKTGSSGGSTGNSGSSTGNSGGNAGNSGTSGSQSR